MMRNMVKMAAAIALGCLVTWFAINVSEGPGIIVASVEEAEGLRFSDPSSLDLLSDVKHRRNCPSQSQRYVWRWETPDGTVVDDGYSGEKLPHIVPIYSTVVPFLGPDGKLLLTLPVTGVPDPVNGKWRERTNAVENCPFLPGWFSRWFSPRLIKGPDVPVNFVGAPHNQTDPAP